MKAIRLRAVDWATFGDQHVPDDHKFEVTKGELCGFVVREDEEMLVLAQQIFTDGTYRAVLVVPKVCILEREELTARYVKSGDAT